MAYVLLILSTLAAVVVLIAFILGLGLWMRGVGPLLFPGLGLVVGTPLLLLLLLFLEVVFVLLAAYSVRLIPSPHPSTGEVSEGHR